eukprot:TRINITY_DN681_c3_g1_i1.p1 TRINITY_DN681_c3_g1~~TRINITY_DN681_c3_g1_i1.p1  ORF type:complete len:291 (+),score=68.91 TRINITY_DN681_c3_g1_i1:52-924(+)
MSGGAQALTVVKRLHELSGDVANQPYIARRGILPTLKSFLGNSELEVQVVAAKTLALLASHPDNPECISQEPGMISAIVKAFESSDDKELKETLDKVMGNLKSVLPDPKKQAAASGATKNKKAYPSVPEHHKRQIAPRTKAGDRVKAQRRHMLVRLPELNSSNVDDIEHLLQHIRGMISYSIDTQNKTLTLFLSTPRQILAKHLTDVGFQMEVVEETLAKQGGKSSGPGPAYLSSGEPQESDYKRSLVVQGGDGGGSSSLSSRLERQRKRNQASDEDRGSVAGFFRSLLS